MSATAPSMGHNWEHLQRLKQHPFMNRLLVFTTLTLMSYIASESCHQAGVLVWRLTNGGVPPSCRADNEGAYAIGIYKGSSPFTLQPIEKWKPRADGDTAWPISNPVFTCAHMPIGSTSFVADPFLLMESDSKMYMFFESKTLRNMQGDIGAAVSEDGGRTWSSLGIVLDEPWHLSYPWVFKHKEQMYMLPEGTKSKQLILYTTTSFPTGWTKHSVLIDDPIVDASLVAPLAPGIAHSDGKWYMFASNQRRKSSKGCQELEVWYADDALGPWKLLQGKAQKEWVQGSRNAGRPFVLDGKLYRVGQDCYPSYGMKVKIYQVLTLNSTAFEEIEVHPHLDFASGRRGESAWVSMRHHHMDAQPLPDGSGWVAVIDGDRYTTDYLVQGWLGRFRTLIILSLAFALLCTLILFYSAPLSAFFIPILQTFASCIPIFSAFLRGVIPRPAFIRLIAAPGQCWGWCDPVRVSYDSRFADVELMKKQAGMENALMAGLGPCPSSSAHHSWSLRGMLSKLDAIMLRPRPLFMGLSFWRFLMLLAVACILGYTGFLLVVSYGRLHILSFILWYLKAWGGSPHPIAVNNTYSKFSILVMSFEARAITLKAFVQHYQQCSSVGEIVVVWNKGVPPLPGRDFYSQVPVRVRVEPRNSMNNRFKHDPELSNRGILMLDDDILMPCSDLERGFARWRQHPERITGFYARLLEGSPPQYHCSRCEGHTYASGQFNVVLAGAAFMDRVSVFEAYNSPDNKEGREYVDRVFNCDDLLLNFLMAHRLGDKQHAEWIRPTKRFDVGKLTSKRLSTGNFGPVRHNCTRDFAAIFDNPLKEKAYSLNFEGRGKPWCPPGLGCVFV